MKQYKSMWQNVFPTLIPETYPQKGSFFFFSTKFLWTEDIFLIQIKLYYAYHYVSASFFLMAI